MARASFFRSSAHAKKATRKRKATLSRQTNIQVALTAKRRRSHPGDVETSDEEEGTGRSTGEKRVKLYSLDDTWGTFRTRNHLL
jgi:hypothetical protein